MRCSMHRSVRVQTRHSTVNAICTNNAVFARETYQDVPILKTRICNWSTFENAEVRQKNHQTGIFHLLRTNLQLFQSWLCVRKTRWLIFHVVWEIGSSKLWRSLPSVTNFLLSIVSTRSAPRRSTSLDNLYHTLFSGNSVISTKVLTTGTAPFIWCEVRRESFMSLIF